MLAIPWLAQAAANLRKLAMSDAHSQTAGASLGRTEALLAGVLAAAQAALPQGLDLLVWGASRLGDQATLRYLLANGGGTSWTPSEDDELEGGNSCLWVASAGGHEGAVRELLDSGVDVDEVRTDDGTTALFVAAQEGHEGVVEELLKAEADVNKATTDDNGATPLFIAALYGHERAVGQLLKAGADVNKATADFGATPLYIAAQVGHEGVVEQLLKAGADVNKATTDDGTPPLYIAAQVGHKGVVEQLLKAGADVNKATTDDGATPLYVAAQDGHEGVVEQLLKAGADPNAERTSGTHRTSLGVASFYGHNSICSLLLEAGANVNGASEEAPVLLTAVTRGHREVALVLMEHGASSSDGTLTPAMLEDLTKWMAEALKENKNVVEAKNRQIEQMVKGIPEWCAQAASCVAAEVQNDGSCDASAPLHPSCVGRKRKSPSTGE